MFVSSFSNSVHQNMEMCSSMQKEKRDINHEDNGGCYLKHLFVSPLVTEAFQFELRTNNLLTTVSRPVDEAAHVQMYQRWVSGTGVVCLEAQEKIWSRASHPGQTWRPSTDEQWETREENPTKTAWGGQMEAKTAGDNRCKELLGLTQSVQSKLSLEQKGTVHDTIDLWTKLQSVCERVWEFFRSQLAPHSCPQFFYESE